MTEWAIFFWQTGTLPGATPITAACFFLVAWAYALAGVDSLVSLANRMLSRRR